MKKSLLLLLTILLLTGCTVTRMDNIKDEEVIDKILSLDIKLYNKVGNGYKYYVPKGVVRTYANEYNDVLKRNDKYYYLYVDVVSYYYKTKVKFKEDSSAYYSSVLNHNKKKGYVKIIENKDNLYVQIWYNYAKIETYTKKSELKETLSDVSYILSSVNFNDSLLKKMYESKRFGSKDEQYKLFDKKDKEGNFLEYIKEYDKYEEKEEEKNSEEKEIKIKETTTKNNKEENKEKEEVVTTTTTSSN